MGSVFISSLRFPTCDYFAVLTFMISLPLRILSVPVDQTATVLRFTDTIGSSWGKMHCIQLSISDVSIRTSTAKPSKTVSETDDR